MEPPRFGRAGRPGSRLRQPPGDPLAALDALFVANPAPSSPSPAPRHGAPPGNHQPPAVHEPFEPDGDRAVGSTPAPVAARRTPADEPAPLRLWWDDPNDRRPLPDRPRAHSAHEWPRPAIPPGAPLPPYEGCHWPRACAVLALRVSCLSLLPCRCQGGLAAARSSDHGVRGSRRRDAESAR